MGAWIVWKAITANATTSEPPSWVIPLGFGGGFLDAADYWLGERVRVLRDFGNIAHIPRHDWT
jgi:hypothetical protein